MYMSLLAWPGRLLTVFRDHFWLFVSVVLTLILAQLYIVWFVPQVVVAFRYDGTTCVNRLTLAPKFQRYVGSTDWRLQFGQDIKMYGRRIASGQLCFVPTAAPVEGSSAMAVAPWGWWAARTRLLIKVSTPPIVDSSSLDKPLPLAKALTFPSSSQDRVFDYVAEANNKQAECEMGKDRLSCPAEKLELSQGQTYPIEVNRYFADQKVATVVKDEVAILPAVTIETTSIAADQTVYDKPAGVTLTASKPLRQATATLTNQAGEAIDLNEPVLNGNTIELTWVAELPRPQRYVLTLAEAEGEDGSLLATAYQLPFYMSGGPRVASVSIGHSGVALGSSAVLSFDQELKPGQDWRHFVQVTGGGSLLQRGRTIVVDLGQLGPCAQLTVSVSPGLVSSFGLAGTEPWSFNSRMVCHTTQSIGTSIQGRPIIAYVFGSGSTTMLFTGAIHGNEVSAKRLMDNWINELEAKVDQIPAGRRVVIIPVVNPDGYVLGSRANARGVDLNRNWDVSDWQADITNTANQPLPGGGGSAPMSEPETQALAAFTQSTRPRLTMSFHAKAAVVIGNQAADSVSLATEYARITGYYQGTGQSSTIFAYQITGTYDDWILEKLGLASVLVELSSATDPQWSRNKPALWAMLGS
jgi:hypothetical protein